MHLKSDLVLTSSPFIFLISFLYSPDSISEFTRSSLSLSNKLSINMKGKGVASK